MVGHYPQKLGFLGVDSENLIVNPLARSGLLIHMGLGWVFWEQFRFPLFVLPLQFLFVLRNSG